MTFMRVERIVALKVSPLAFSKHIYIYIYIERERQTRRARKNRNISAF